MDGPDTTRSTSGARWWIKPALISLVSIAVVPVAVTLLVGWSTPVIVVVVVGFALGCWWFLDQRPGRS